MNGRVYDPLLGMFLSPDPYVQAPGNWLNYNRYGYCLNNPLIYTDPDGEVWWLVPLIAAAVFGAGNTVAHAVRGDINSIGDGFKYFGQGFAVGAILGSAWQFSPLIPVVGNAIQIGMTGYAVTQGGVGTLGTIAGGLVHGKEGAANAAKAFLGNFYLDENSFGGGLLQGVSRHSWEFLQTLIGHGYTQVNNTIGNVDRVDYFGGATFATNEYSGKRNGITIGSFININIRDGIQGNFDDKVLTDQLYMHEYGHYRQSLDYGFGYLFSVGIPSVFSAKRSSRIPETELTTHGVKWYERRANGKAVKYFDKYKNISFWDETRYPIKMPVF